MWSINASQGRTNQPSSSKHEFLIPPHCLLPLLRPEVSQAFILLHLSSKIFSSAPTHKHSYPMLVTQVTVCISSLKPSIDIEYTMLMSGHPGFGYGLGHPYLGGAPYFGHPYGWVNLYLGCGILTIFLKIFIFQGFAHPRSALRNTAQSFRRGTLPQTSSKSRR